VGRARVVANSIAQQQRCPVIGGSTFAASVGETVQIRRDRPRKLGVRSDLPIGGISSKPAQFKELL
jgi:hypothetical protein